MTYRSPEEGCDLILSWLDTTGKEIWKEHHVQYTHDCFQMHSLATEAGLKTVRVRNLQDEFFSPSKNTHVYIFEV